jgi:hypothetical protein
MYIFDTSAFIVLKHYYRQSFPSLWTGIEELIERRLIASTREVYNELQSNNDADYIQTWANDQREIFATPPTKSWTSSRAFSKSNTSRRSLARRPR